MINLQICTKPEASTLSKTIRMICVICPRLDFSLVRSQQVQLTTQVQQSDRMRLREEIDLGRLQIRSVQYARALGVQDSLVGTLSVVSLSERVLD